MFSFLTSTRIENVCAPCFVPLTSDDLFLLFGAVRINKDAVLAAGVGHVRHVFVGHRVGLHRHSNKGGGGYGASHG